MSRSDRDTSGAFQLFGTGWLEQPNPNSSSDTAGASGWSQQSKQSNQDNKINQITQKQTQNERATPERTATGR